MEEEEAAAAAGGDGGGGGGGVELCGLVYCPPLQQLVRSTLPPGFDPDAEVEGAGQKSYEILGRRGDKWMKVGRRWGGGAGGARGTSCMSPRSAP
jgi:hypothetical protein